MTHFPYEVSGRLIEIYDDARPLLDTLKAMDADLVSIGSRLLDGSTVAGEMHVCVSFTSSGAAISFLSRLIEVAAASASLRASLTEQGHPQITEIGARQLVWWPALKGQPVSMH